MRILKKYGRYFLPIALCLMLAGCQSHTDGQPVKEKNPKAEYELLQVVDDLLLNEDEGETLCYCDEKTLIFSIGPRNGASEGPLNATTCLVEYDLQEKKIRNQYQEHAFWTVYSAVPIDDGIVYVCYEDLEDAFQWQIKYQSMGEEKILDSGICDSYDDPSQVFFLGETPVFLFEDRRADGTKVVGLKKIINNRVETVFESDDYSLDNSFYANNGKNYIFAARDNEEKQCLLIGNQENLIVEEPITDGFLNSFGINENEAFYSVCEGKGQSSFYRIDLKTKQITKLIEEVRQYYRLNGSGESIVCVDSGFKLYVVNTESGELQSIGVPEEYMNLSVPASISFSPLSENKYITQFNDEYWLMKIIQ